MIPTRQNPSELSQTPDTSQEPDTQQEKTEIIVPLGKVGTVLSDTVSANQYETRIFQIEKRLEGQREVGGYDPDDILSSSVLAMWKTAVSHGGLRLKVPKPVTEQAIANVLNAYLSVVVRNTIARVAKRSKLSIRTIRGPGPPFLTLHDAYGEDDFGVSTITGNDTPTGTFTGLPRVDARRVYEGEDRRCLQLFEFAETFHSLLSEQKQAVNRILPPEYRFDIVETKSIVQLNSEQIEMVIIAIALLPFVLSKSHSAPYMRYAKVLIFDIAGWSTEEVCRALDIDRDTLYLLRHRARKALRSFFK